MLILAAVMKAVSIFRVFISLYFCVLASTAGAQAHLCVGAERTAEYMPLLRGKRVGLYTNHTGRVGNRMTVDVMLDSAVNVVTLFSPEHGIRGQADAGEHVASGRDPVTGIPIASLYTGKRRGPEPAVIKGLDVIVVDIQDVGLRFYTYYCTMLELMQAAAEHGKEVIILDRPNPNGMTVDGPVLDMKYASGVGRLPIPVVHGLTLGEMALMAVGEGWLPGARNLKLTVIPCTGYTHDTRYELPVWPSPNLRDMTAIYLYPSMCYFEATDVSLGRGTDKPFMIYGHPLMRGRTYEFTPRSMAGAKNPPQLNRLCHGVDLSSMDREQAIAQGVNLEYLIDAYRDLSSSPGYKGVFFSSFFEKLMGRGDIRGMIEQGMSAEQIKATWADEVRVFREQRRPYLLYPDSSVASDAIRKEVQP